MQRHFPQTPICKGRHLCHAIQLARLSSLILHHQPCGLFAERDQVPVFWVSSVPLSRVAVPGVFFSPSTSLLLRLSIPPPIEPPSTLPISKIKCLHARESRMRRRRSCRPCLVTKARKKKSKALFLTSCAALCVRVVNWCHNCCCEEVELCHKLWIVNWPYLSSSPRVLFALR